MFSKSLPEYPITTGTARAEEKPLFSPSLQLLALIITLCALSIGLAFRVSGNVGYADAVLRSGLLLGSAAVFLEVSRDFLQGKWGSDLLAVLSILVSIALEEHVAGLVIVLMVSGGEMLEGLATSRASSVLAALAKRMPQVAMRRDAPGQITTLPIEELTLGDKVVVAPHAVCPTDGIVSEGYGVMDEAYLTGEPTSIPKAPGSAVLSGAVNGENALVVEVTKRAKDSRYAQIVRVIEETSELKVPLRRLGDRLGALFTPLALAIALLTWWFSGDSTRFLTVLVVATPCPLILSIPVAILGAVSVAARQGILIRQAGLLEVLPKCTTLILDKTGTLTMGEPHLTEIRLLHEVSEPEVLALVGSLEQYSRHPLGRAIVLRVRELNIPLRPVKEVSERPGKGLSGVVDGRIVRASGRKAIAHLELGLSDATRGLECIVWVDETPAAQLLFRDTPRPESKPFVKHLSPKHSFSKIMIVSGDRSSEVAYIGETLGIRDIRAEVSPEGKLEIVKEEKEHANVVFIGDGINDAPSLVEATVGIALGEGNEVTGTAADAVILNSSLREVDRLFHLSIRTRRIILQSVGFGMLASIGAMAIASLGYLTPTAGAIVQEVIDLFSLGNALRISFVKREMSDF